MMSIKSLKETTGLRRLPRIILASALIFALCMGMTACGQKKEQITIEQLVAANSTEKLLSQYSSIYEVSGDHERYVESELRYYMDDEQEELQTPDNTYGRTGEEYHGTIMVGGKWAYDSDYFACLGLEPVSTALEEVEKVENNGGTSTMYTVLSTENYAKLSLPSLPAYQDGDYVKCRYKFDSKTLAVLESQSTLYRADGTSQEEPVSTVTYNAPRPKGVEALLERLSDPQKLRTVTVIADPGTDKERITSAFAPKGESVQFFAAPEDGEWALYTDAGCTEVYAGGASKDEDFTIYCKQK